MFVDPAALARYHAGTRHVSADRQAWGGCLKKDVIMETPKRLLV